MYRAAQPSPKSNMRAFASPKKTHCATEQSGPFTRPALREPSCFIGLQNHKWNYTICGLLCLPSFPSQNVEVCPCGSKYQGCFASFYCSIAFPSTKRMFYCSVHQSTDICTIMRNAAVNICLQVFFQMHGFISFGQRPSSF